MFQNKNLIVYVTTVVSKDVILKDISSELQTKIKVGGKMAVVQNLYQIFKLPASFLVEHNCNIRKYSITQGLKEGNIVSIGDNIIFQQLRYIHGDFRNHEELFGYIQKLRNNMHVYKKKGQYKEAHNLFSQYIATASAPILAEYNITPETDEYMTDIAAYYSVQAGLQAGDNNLAMKNIDIAKLSKDPEMSASIYRLEASTYLNMGDSVKWIELLKAGVERNPEDQYYYSNLISYYVNNGNTDELMIFADEMLEKNPLPIFHFVKGFIYQNMPDYENAVEEYKVAIEQDPNYVGAYRNLGICYCQLAQNASDKMTGLNIKSKAYKEQKEIVNNYYRLALPIYEHLRKVDDGTDPDVRSAWTNGLYTCYYMLNMGKEFDEIEKIINN